MTSATIIVERITKDRIEELLNLLKKNPIHQVRKIFKKKYKIDIASKTIQKIYEVWLSESGRPAWALISDMRKQDWWDAEVERHIAKQTKSDLADFIYSYWKKEQK